MAKPEPEPGAAPPPRPANVAPYVQAIEYVRDDFVRAAGELLKYPDEAVFAVQAVSKTDYSLKVANQNPRSLQLAMRNLAATGLSLNPAHGYAYLVPRDNQIVLDISYRGLIKIATDAGAVLWARADVVHDADKFVYRGPAALPDHEAEAFRPRGELIGVYCIARVVTGDTLTEVMTREEVEKIRAKSDLYRVKKSGPWVEWFEQMCKKAVIKRASKTWPYTQQSHRLLDAVERANESEGGYTLGADGQPLATPEQIGEINGKIAELADAGRPVDFAAFKAWLNVQELDELPQRGVDLALNYLGKKLNAKPKGDQK